MTERTLTMSDAEIQTIQALAEAATKGPWLADNIHIAQNALHPDGNTLLFNNGSGDDMYSNFTVDDMAFIAAARTVVPALLSALAEAHSENAELRERAEQAEASVVMLADYIDGLCDETGKYGRSGFEWLYEKAGTKSQQEYILEYINSGNELLANLPAAAAQRISDAKAQAERVKTLEVALLEMVKYYGPSTAITIPEKYHIGSCGPQSECDGACMDQANALQARYILMQAEKALVSHTAAQ